MHPLDSNEDPMPLWIHQILKPTKLEFTEDAEADEKTEPKSSKCTHQSSEKENTDFIEKDVDSLSPTTSSKLWQAEWVATNDDSRDSSFS